MPLYLEKNNKYYVSVMVEVPNVNKKEIVGIDLGVKKLLTLSDGKTYDNNKYIQKYEKKIERLQRELSRKEKGSKISPSDNNKYGTCT